MRVLPCVTEVLEGYLEQELWMRIASELDQKHRLFPCYLDHSKMQV